MKRDQEQKKSAGQLALVTTPASAAPPADGSICTLQPASADNLLDLSFQSALAKITMGVSPTSLVLAWVDWAMHLASSPGTQLDLAARLNQQATEWLPYVMEAASRAPGTPPADPSIAADPRFAYTGWANWPFSGLAKSFLQTQDFWQAATSGIRGMSPHHAHVVNFAARQWLDVFSPSNSPLLNPEVLRASADTHGRNHLIGWSNWLADQGQMGGGAEKPAYKVGQDVALTPGKVVYRNDLIELIQYGAQGATVYREPLLIVPSWIMKYYILDLSPHNSMVHYLVGQGHTVFMISWKNPDADDRNLGLNDYLEQGLFAAQREIARITGGTPLHAAGYCLGGTLLAIGAAALGRAARPGITPLRSVTLLAAQTDFTDPGELGLFIDDSELAYLDAVMAERGYLDGPHMTGSFQLLNSRDLVWSHAMREYLLGIRSSPNDLMSWNADTTRLPYRMHSEYLKHLFLHNDLAEGRYCVGGHPVVLSDITMPMFVVGTERDHVSPWRSVYKIRFLSGAEVHFVLASGGHNAGIVSEPGHAHRSYQFLPEQKHKGGYIGPDEWLTAASTESGSWWTHWQAWLARHSSAEKIAAPVLAAALDDAPGRYVLGN